MDDNKSDLNLITEYLQKAQYHEAEATRWRQWAAQAQERINCRELDTLQPEIGMQLSVTLEQVDHSKKQYNTGYSGYNLGDVVVIVQVDSERGGVVIATGINHGIHEWTPLDIARRMRIAYLQAHGEAQP